MVRRVVARLLVVCVYACRSCARVARPLNRKTKTADHAPEENQEREAVYPDAAQRPIGGTVVIEATVGTDGKVRDAKVTRSVPLLDEPAVAAVQQWEYEPAPARSREEDCRCR